MLLKIWQEGGDMFIQQADIFWGTSHIFVREVMHITMKESYNKGDFIFHAGDRAGHLYILLKGRVKLSLGVDKRVVYVVSHAGEAFGWSSLVEREVYSASAECMEPTELISIAREKFEEILEKDPVNGLIFYKRLAGTIGNRLLHSYEIISATSEAEISPSFGAGDLQESGAKE
jgi:CRP-like cAMP-binding protein